MFTLDAHGKLSFKSASDLEDPKDKGQNHTHSLNAHAEDLSGNQSSQHFASEIENVDEKHPPAPSDPEARELVINPKTTA